MKRYNLVCIHGNSQAPEVFKNLEVEGCQKILVTLPGHAGRKIGNTKSFLDMVNAVYHDVKAIPDMVLVGLSLGGHVAHHLLADIQPEALFSIAAPPLTNLDSISKAFSPHPFLPYLFQNHMSDMMAGELARSMLQDRHPGVTDLTQMILGTTPEIRGLIGASITRGEFKNEVELLQKYRGKKVFVYPTKDNFVSEVYIKSLNIAPVRDIEGAHVLTMDNAPSLNHFIRLVLFGK